MAIEPNGSRRPAAAARMLSLSPVTGGDLAVAFQIIEAILERRGEIRLIRVGTATVAVAGTELEANEVGGDGANAAEAVVAVACDMVRFDALRPAYQIDETDEDGDIDHQQVFAW